MLARPLLIPTLQLDIALLRELLVQWLREQIRGNQSLQVHR
jgi:hypothetical protein